MKLQLSQVHKSYGAQDVLQGANLQVRGNEKIALVGRNGCGKTTLLRIITGEEEADSGSRFVENGLRIGYLSQITFTEEGRTVREELMDAFAEVIRLEKAVEEQARVLETDSSEKQLNLYDELQRKFESKGGYEYEYELKSVFTNFGFEEQELDKTISEFSSGQKTRIALVKLLLSKPDLLLLDEPTNHLDVDSIEWLESYLSRYPSAVILVSHDRMFLDHTADEIVELEFGTCMRYPGSYTHYLQAKDDYLQKNHEAYLRQQKEIDRLNALIEKFRYKKNKAAFAQSKMKYLDRMDRIEDSKSDRSRMKASFSSERKGGEKVLEVQNLKIGYDSILSDVSFKLMRQDHMAIVGPNGIGKSTLLKTLMSELPPKGGTWQFGHQIDAGYFDQEAAMLKTDKTVIDELWDEHPDATQTEIRSTLARFLFTQDEVFKETASISGGERVELALAKLMMNHDNLLILDEPTNHLDIPAREALEDALKEYDGTVLFVSHDRMFLSKMATRVLEFKEDGTSRVYPFGYSEYMQRKKDGTLPTDQFEQNARSGKGSQAVNKSESPARLSFAARNTLTNRVARLEQLIPEAEAAIEELEDLRYEPEYYQDYRKMEELEDRIDQKKNELHALNEEWEEKAMMLESQ